MSAVVDRTTFWRAALEKVALFFLLGHLAVADEGVEPQAGELPPWRLVSLVETLEDSKVQQRSKDHIPLPVGRVASIGTKSRLEFIGPSGQILRTGHNTSFSPVSEQSIEFRSGAFLLYFPKDSPPYEIITPGVNVGIHSYGTFLGEIMPKGGIKLIPLEGRGEILFKQAGTTEKLTIGQIHFYLPEGKRPVNVKVYLPLLLGSCTLINAFENELPSAPRMIYNARIQARKTKTRTGTFVYDAVDEDQLRFLVPKSVKGENPQEPKKQVPKLNNPFKGLFGRDKE